MELPLSVGQTGPAFLLLRFWNPQRCFSPSPALPPYPLSPSSWPLRLPLTHPCSSSTRLPTKSHMDSQNDPVGPRCQLWSSGRICPCVWFCAAFVFAPPLPSLQRGLYPEEGNFPHESLSVSCQRSSCMRRAPLVRLICARPSRLQGAGDKP